MGNLRRDRELSSGELKTRCEYAHARTAVITSEVSDLSPPGNPARRGDPPHRNPQDALGVPWGFLQFVCLVDLMVPVALLPVFAVLVADSNVMHPP